MVILLDYQRRENLGLEKIPSVTEMWIFFAGLVVGPTIFLGFSWREDHCNWHGIWKHLKTAKLIQMMRNIMNHNIIIYIIIYIIIIIIHINICFSIVILYSTTCSCGKLSEPGTSSLRQLSDRMGHQESTIHSRGRTWDPHLVNYSFSICWLSEHWMFSGFDPYKNTVSHGVCQVVCTWGVPQYNQLICEFRFPPKRGCPSKCWVTKYNHAIYKILWMVLNVHIWC